MIDITELKRIIRDYEPDISDAELEWLSKRVAILLELEAYNLIRDLKK